jgi:hypothetical protein
MTEDILFDNLYIGHSAADAKALAAESFEVKKPLEVAADKPEVTEEDEEETASFKDDPINFIRTHALAFIEAAKADPVQAFKSQPETGAALVGALLTLFGMLGVLTGIIGGAQKPVVTKVCRPYNSATFCRSSLFLSPPRRWRLQRKRPPPPWRPLLRRRMMVSRSATSSRRLCIGL